MTPYLLHALSGVGRLVAVGNELITVAALLWSLNFLAGLIEKTWKAGYAVGTVARRIDWLAVATTVKDGIVFLAVATYTAGFWTGKAVHWLNDRLAAAVVSTAAAPAVPPIVNPLFDVAAGLQAKTSKELRQITGIRSKCSKHHLIAYAFAA